MNQKQHVSKINLPPSNIGSGREGEGLAPNLSVLPSWSRASTAPGGGQPDPVNNSKEGSCWTEANVNALSFTPWDKVRPKARHQRGLVHNKLERKNNYEFFESYAEKAKQEECCKTLVNSCHEEPAVRLEQLSARQVMPT